MVHATRVPPSESVPFELVTLSDGLADGAESSSVTIAPARGALVTSFAIGGRELLYLDPTTLVDPSRSVRGGIPVLFPSPGKLDGDAFVSKGGAFAMKQHGFARALPWNVTSCRENTPSLELTLESNDETRRQYPFDFALTFRFSLRGRTLRIEQRVENRSREPMPFAMGFHPYFLVEDKASATVETRATRAFDNATKEIVPFSGLDFTRGEVDLHLEDHGGASSALDLGDGTRVEMRGSEEFWRWVIWTLPGKNFVCVEPWTAAGNALNTGQRLLTVESGAARELFVEFGLRSG